MLKNHAVWASRNDGVTVVLTTFTGVCCSTQQSVLLPPALPLTLIIKTSLWGSWCLLTIRGPALPISPSSFCPCFLPSLALLLIPLLFILYGFLLYACYPNICCCFFHSKFQTEKRKSMVGLRKVQFRATGKVDQWVFFFFCLLFPPLPFLFISSFF